MVRAAALLLLSDLQLATGATQCHGTCAARLSKEAVLLQSHSSKVTVAEESRGTVELEMPSQAEIQEWLDAHNGFRCEHGAAPLTWSSAMAASAQEWANGLTVLDHSDSYDLPPPAGPSGENLAGGYTSITGAVTGWYEEVNDCVTLPGCETGRGGAAVGHFTALIWKGAKQLGCGINRARRIYVCRYKGDDRINANTPNLQGAYRQNVVAAGVRPKPAGCDAGTTDMGERPGSHGGNEECEGCGPGGSGGDLGTCETGVNFALNQPVTCSAGMTGPCSKAVDGLTDPSENKLSPQTKFTSCANQAYVQVDLGSTKRVDQAKIFAMADGTRKYCSRKVQVSQDGSSWHTAYDNGQNFSPTQPATGTVLSFDRLHQARYVRVFTSKSNIYKGANFIEIQVSCENQASCCPPPPPPPPAPRPAPRPVPAPRPMPQPTPAPTPTPSSDGQTGPCIAAGSLGKCQNCLSSVQCGGGRFCCPFMKKCVISSSEGCRTPIAFCSPPCHETTLEGIQSSCNCGQGSWANGYEFQVQSCTPGNMANAIVFTTTTTTTMDLGAVSSTCTPRKSVGSCGACLNSDQCEGTRFCCPFMKRCVHSRQPCSYPIANCRPGCYASTLAETKQCQGCNPIYSGWVWPGDTCGSLLDQTNSTVEEQEPEEVSPCHCDPEVGGPACCDGSLLETAKKASAVAQKPMHSPCHCDPETDTDGHCCDELNDPDFDAE